MSMGFITHSCRWNTKGRESPLFGEQPVVCLQVRGKVLDQASKVAASILVGDHLDIFTEHRPFLRDSLGNVRVCND
ncbi:hypothetical protein Plhal304r1_c018g0063541 [Plasmopara halstedii]